MFSSHQCAVLSASGCEVAFDNLTRQLYATDASIYQITPGGVAFPKNAAEAAAVLRSAGEGGVSVIPRGAGTGLVGGAIGEGLIIDLARETREIRNLDLEARTVEVGAGVVLDQLNAFLRPHGLRFGPDVATSSRATLGGMIACNSSGAHVPVFGTTADHVLSLEVVLADGRVEVGNRESDSLREQCTLVDKLVKAHAGQIGARMPPGLLKRWPGYGLDRWLRSPGNLNDIISGSEGTLAGITSAKLRVVPLPRQKGLGLIFFASVAEAMQATVELLPLKPAAIEHVDRVLFEQTRDQVKFKAARDLLELESKPCEAFLIAEFYEDVVERLEALGRMRLGLRKMVVTKPSEMELVWGLRKAGLALLTGCKGPAKPVTCIEDTAVRPERLPAYVAGVRSILERLNLNACFYGHAASGLLHIRPVLDLHTAEDVKRLRQLTAEISALVREFKGSLAGEHGVGLARTEFLPEHLGPELLEAMRQIKVSFDPGNRFNPGKIIGDGRYKLDRDLRLGAGYKLKLPFEPVLAFAAKDGSFVRNLEQCNGCGGCRKEAPTMCPTFIATGLEVMSTRGRANTIRRVLEGRLQRQGAECSMQNGAAPLPSLLFLPELEVALSNCLGCKACTTECPSNVNLTLLKAELVHARHRAKGLSFRERVLSSVDVLGKLGCLAPRLANACLKSSLVRWAMEKAVGLHRSRPLPEYAMERFDVWFWERKKEEGRKKTGAVRGKVILWDDTFVRYYEPGIGKAAVGVLEAAGFEVVLLEGRVCCGRPAFSQGNLDRAAKLGRHNLELITKRGGDEPILFLEPSCYSMFAQDYRELKLPGAEEVSRRCYLFEEFMEKLLEREPDALQFKGGTERVAIHAHCHAKSLLNPGFMVRLAKRVPGREAVLLESGCCGMAGAFGAMASKYELSVKVAEPLVKLIQGQPKGTAIVASGTSCRQQIEHLTGGKAMHMAEWLFQSKKEE